MERVDLETIKLMDIIKKISNGRKFPKFQTGGFIEYKNRRLYLRRADLICATHKGYTVTSSWIPIEGKKPSEIMYPIRKRRKQR